MNIELDQQQKFTEQFAKLAEVASQKFKERWNKEIYFINPTHNKMIPSFGSGVIDLLSVDLRNKFEILRGKYFSKSL